jgi:hypothetical protein
MHWRIETISLTQLTQQIKGGEWPRSTLAFTRARTRHPFLLCWTSRALRQTSKQCPAASPVGYSSNGGSLCEIGTVPDFVLRSSFRHWPCCAPAVLAICDYLSLYLLAHRHLLAFAVKGVAVPRPPVQDGDAGELTLGEQSFALVTCERGNDLSAQKFQNDGVRMRDCLVFQSDAVAVCRDACTFPFSCRAHSREKRAFRTWKTPRSPQRQSRCWRESRGSGTSVSAF